MEFLLPDHSGAEHRKSIPRHRHPKCSVPGCFSASLLERLKIGGGGMHAEQYLTETQRIVERGPMPLYLADVHVHRARLIVDRSEPAKALTLIEKHHCGRRRKELADAPSAAAHW